MSADPLRPMFDAARAGNERSMAEFVRATQSDVWRLCRALGSTTDADDLTQETFLRAFRSASAFRGDSTVRAWLMSIARHTCADHVRRVQRQRRLVDKLTATAEPTVSIPPDDTSRLLIDLRPERREAFVLTQVIGLNYEEAAAVVNCPVGTIRSRVARARLDLLEAVKATEAI